MTVWGELGMSRAASFLIHLRGGQVAYLESYSGMSVVSRLSPRLWHDGDTIACRYAWLQENKHHVKRADEAGRIGSIVR